MGINLAENTIGAFVMAKDKYEIKKAIKTVIKLPNIWLFSIGIIFNITEIKLSSQIIITMQQIKTTYTVIGMMIIGISFANLKINKINWQQVLKMIFVKHIWQPAWFFLVIPILVLFFPFDLVLKKILLIQSFCPIAGNIIIFASVFEQKTNDIAIALFLSTILSFITIPILTYFL